MKLRRATLEDLPAIAAIQSACPQAAQWNPAEYLEYETLAAIFDDRVAGFLVSRVVAEHECEILSVAVSPEFRRRGVAKTLISELLRRNGAVYLEVRESNRAARALYQVLGFQEVAARPGYYSNPPEAAIVLKFHSC